MMIKEQHLGWISIRKLNLARLTDDISSYFLGKHYVKLIAISNLVRLEFKHVEVAYVKNNRQFSKQEQC